jgi:hypothetical protein
MLRPLAEMHRDDADGVGEMARQAIRMLDGAMP